MQLIIRRDERNGMVSGDTPVMVSLLKGMLLKFTNSGELGLVPVARGANTKWFWDVLPSYEIDNILKLGVPNLADITHHQKSLVHTLRLTLPASTWSFAELHDLRSPDVLGRVRAMEVGITATWQLIAGCLSVHRCQNQQVSVLGPWLGIVYMGLVEDNSV